MTRKEEIIQASEELGFWKAGEAMFTAGAEWADQHPRKGLWDSKKVIEFLKDRIAHNSIAYLMTTKYLIDDLKKTMEEDEDV